MSKMGMQQQGGMGMGMGMGIGPGMAGTSLNGMVANAPPNADKVSAC